MAGGGPSCRNGPLPLGDRSVFTGNVGLCGVLLHRHAVRLEPHAILHQVVSSPARPVSHRRHDCCTAHLAPELLNESSVAIEDAEAREHRGMRHGNPEQDVMVAVSTSRNGVLNRLAALLNESVTIVLQRRCCPLAPAGQCYSPGRWGEPFRLPISSAIASKIVRCRIRPPHACENLFGSITPGIPVERPRSELLMKVHPIAGSALGGSPWSPACPNCKVESPASSRSFDTM